VRWEHKEVADAERSLGLFRFSVVTRMVLTSGTAIVDKPADEDEHAGHHHGHAH
jgi:hypothetical protein